jgi:gliding motility-associated-like protein
VTIYLNGLIYIPNAFTPEGNDLNEFFAAKGFQIKEFEMIIYNRWGEEIFYSDSLQKGWDGKYMGEPAKPDLYIYKVIYKDFGGKENTLFGHVTLLR